MSDEVPLPMGSLVTEGAEERLRSVINDCVHCGFCLPACPTYQLWGEEMDSPRGRIHLVSQLLDGAPLTAAASVHFDRCLGCMACMTACPSECSTTRSSRRGGSGQRRPPGPPGCSGRSLRM